MFKDAQQGVWDGVQEHILICVLRKWGRRYKSVDEENLTDNAGQFNYCTSNSAKLSRLFLSSTVHTFSSSLLIISTHFHCYLVRLLCRHYLSCRGAGLVSLTCWAHWLFFYHHFIRFKYHFFSRCDNMIRLVLFLGSAIVVARLIQTSLHKYFKIIFSIQLCSLPFTFTFTLHFQDRFFDPAL